MSLKINIVNCPSCGAAIPITEGHSQLTCSYCGTKLNITNENEHIIRHVDEAQVKHVEVEQMIRLRELEMEEKKRKVENLKLVGMLGVLLLCVFLTFIGEVFNILGMSVFGMLGMMFVFLCFFGVLMDKRNSKESEKSSNSAQTPQIENINGIKTLPSFIQEEKVFGNHFCGNCGTRLLDDARFCHKCGHIVGKLPVPPKVGKQKRKVR